MKRPPNGIPTDKQPGFDDAAIIKSLREKGRCQQRLITDGGNHYIFCGGYYDGKAIKTTKGLRCRFHR
jgi:hypothetical protein